MTTLLVVGPPEHGVTRYAERLARADAVGHPVVRLASAADPVDLRHRDVLLHFTDRLYGPDADRAASRLEEMCRGARRVTVVLHDLPQVSDAAARARRSRGYLRVCDLADVVVVNSDHELRLLRALARTLGERWAARLLGRTHVVPLPVPVPATLPPDPSAPGEGPRTVVTLGFLYPGKGVEEVIDAAAGISPAPALLNLGSVSSGHDDLVPALTRRAAALGLTWSTTGWLSDEALLRATREASVPVAAHRHLSASGSINTWLSAGRRPVVVDSRYAREMARRMPGALWVVQDLHAALQEALADPGRTWLPPGVRPGQDEAQVCARLLALAQADG